MRKPIETIASGTTAALLRQPVLRWSVPLFLAGILLQLMPYFGWNFSTLPGSLDTLFNRYVLEHGYLWLMGEEPSFWNAPFFYPAPLALAYSDCHAGNLPFYALFRIAGFTPDGALQCWILLQYLLNFAACVWMLRKLEFSPLAAAAGGYLFTFAMPVTAQLTHIQLLPRFPIPLAFGALWLFWKKPDLRCFALLTSALFWQFACSIYLGTLLLLALAVLFCCLAIRDRKRKDWRQVLPGGNCREILGRVLLLAIPVLLLAKFLFPPYLVIWRMLNRIQPFSIQLLELPRLSSYFLPADDALCWHWLASLIAVGSYREEHVLFSGIAALAATVAAAWVLCRKAPRNPLLLSAFLCWLVLFCFSLQIGEFSLYKTLREILPGLNSLRSMTRIILVLLLFQAIFVAWAVDRLRAGKFRRWLWIALPILVLEGMVFLPQSRYDKAAVREKVDRIAAQMQELPPRSLVFRYTPGEPGPETNLYTMLAAQQTGMVTINGYSGHNPPGWFAFGWPTPQNWRDALREWRRLSGGVFFSKDPDAPWRTRLYRIP